MADQYEILDQVQCSMTLLIVNAVKYTSGVGTTGAPEAFFFFFFLYIII